MGQTVLLPQLRQGKHHSPSPLGLSLCPSVPWKRNLPRWRSSGCNAAPLSCPAEHSQHGPWWSWPCPGSAAQKSTWPGRDGF